MDDTAKLAGKKLIKRFIVEGFVAFAKLHDWCKQQTDEAGVPVYTISTIQQLAEMVMRCIISKFTLGDIDGIGEAWVKKYADAIYQLYTRSLPDTKKTMKREGNLFYSTLGHLRSRKPAPGFL